LCSGRIEFFAAGKRGDGLEGAIDDAGEAAVALGALSRGTDALGGPGDRGVTVYTEAGVDHEDWGVWARGLWVGEAAAADSADASGSQAAGEQRRQGIVASRTSLDANAVEVVEPGIALWAVDSGRTAIEEVFESYVALGTELRRGRLRDVVDESKWSLHRSDFND
jgi:hypothetical protein